MSEKMNHGLPLYCGRLLVGLFLFFLVACSEPTENAGEDTAASGPSPEPRELFELHCASCHEAEGGKAPALQVLAARSAAGIAFALNNGSMRSQAEILSPQQRYKLASWISEQGESYLPGAQVFCQDSGIEFEPVYVDRWGLDSEKTAYAGANLSGIRQRNVGHLQLRWAFSLPGVSEARSQPVIVGNTLFLGTTGGDLFALDRLSACIRWHKTLAAPVRTALSLAHVGAEPVLFFGDTQSRTSAVSARDGELLWRRDMAVAEHSIQTGAVVYHDDALYVPVSLTEVALARDPEFECCRAHGAVHRLDAETGDIVWTTHMTSEATHRGETRAGTKKWGPSGVPVWSTPTIDASRRVLYVGTGQNASAPATALSDAIVALRLDSGAIAWHFQATAGDTYNDACSAFPKGDNCPRWKGPDFDFGASVIRARDRQGREMLLAGQKSGDVYALDPDNQGKVLWRTRVGSGSALGGVHWGMALAGGRVFVAANDPPFPGYRPRPGLSALSLESGEVLWEFEAERGCDTAIKPYFQRRELYPDCSYYYGYSAALSVANDLVFAPALDGVIRAFSVDSGELHWQYDTRKRFTTVGDGSAHGGSIDVAGMLFADDMAYIQSGYGLFGQLPGNVLLAFGLADPLPGLVGGQRASLPEPVAFDHNADTVSPVAPSQIAPAYRQQSDKLEDSARRESTPDGDRP